MIGRNAQPERINLATFLYLVSLYLYLRSISRKLKNPQNLDILRLEGYFLLIFGQKKNGQNPTFQIKI